MILKKRMIWPYKMKLLTLLGIFTSLMSWGQTLQLGDAAPPLEPYAWIKGKPINEFKKGTIYVVEMGATWCKPCAAAIPELTDLAKKYRGQVEVIGVFVQEINREPKDTPNPKYVETVKNYVNKKGSLMQYHVAVDDPEKNIERTWIDGYGASRGVPQTFVIDKNGSLAAHFKGHRSEELDKTIQAILKESYDLKQEIEKVKKQNAKQIKYDRFKPLFINGNGGDGNDFIFRSVLTKYKGDFRTGRPTAYIRSWQSIEKLFDEKSDDYKRYKALQGNVQVVNCALDQLYYLAHADTLYNRVPGRHPITDEWPDLDSLPWFKGSYGKYWGVPILEVSDKKPFEWNWRSPENKWNYVLSVPKDNGIPSAGYMQNLVQQDLQRYFGYEVSVEIRDMPVWFLKVSSIKFKKSKEQGKKKISGKRLFTDGVEMFKLKNVEIRDIIYQLGSGFNEAFYLYDNKFREPFIDATGIDYQIDYTITRKEVEAFRSRDFKVVQKFLKRLGLYLEKGTKPMKVVVIRDPQ